MSFIIQENAEWCFLWVGVWIQSGLALPERKFVNIIRKSQYEDGGTQKVCHMCRLLLIIIL